MSFTSFVFPLLFAVTTTAFFVVPVRLRWLVLLLASYYFYMSWNAAYVVLLLACTVANYAAGLKIHQSKSERERKLWLIVGLCISLGLLLFYKYASFALENIQNVLQVFALPIPAWQVQILLPVGISFYTFQALSYTIDVYRGEQVPEKHFGTFALFVSFFPQLVAGPIEKASHLLPQLTHTKPFNADDATAGLQRMLLGYFKKLVIADNAAIVVNQVYANPGNFSGPALLLATVLFAFQIYCDFSAYSDIAIGAARVLRINLIENFNRPYAARTVTDFWRRWHMSLMLWFRNYVYIPLGGNRASFAKHSRNILLVFLISGIWHGAAWTFIAWGVLHGLFVWLEMVLKKRSIALPTCLQWLGVPYCFVVVLYSWVLFRAESLSSAVAIGWRMTLETLQWFTGSIELTWRQITDSLILDRLDLLLLATFIVAMEIGQYLMQKQRWQQLYQNNLYLRWGLLYGLIFTIYIFGSFNNESFIYFQF